MPSHEELERTLVNILRCSRCGGSLRLGTYARANEDLEQATCERCGAHFLRLSGIWRMLSPQQHDLYESFLTSYVALRMREGWVRDEDYYLSLPNVPPGDPTEGIWRIRRRSLAILDRAIGAGEGRWALDAGAGCGWLSRYLSSRGYNTVASDLNAEGADGLQGVSTYIDHDRIWIGRVQASMSELPFADESFDLCTVSAALHYAPLEQTLREVWRVLRPSGMLVIADSPVYNDPTAGRTMAAEQRDRAQDLLGTPPALLPGGEGYLVEGQLHDSLVGAGFRPELIQAERLRATVRSRVRAWLVPGRREHARFPVLIGLK